MPSTLTTAVALSPACALTHHHVVGVPRRPAGGRGATSAAAASPLVLPATSAASARRRHGAAWIVQASVSHSHSHVEDDLELMSMAIHTLPRPSVVTTTTTTGTGKHHAGGHSHSRHPHQPQPQQHHDDHRQQHRHGPPSAATTTGTSPRAGTRPTGVLRLGPASDTVRVMSQLRDAVLRQGSAVLLVHDGVVALEDAVDVLVLLSEDVQEAEPGCIAVFQPILSRHSPTCPPHGSSNGSNSGNAACDVGSWAHGPAAAQHGNGHFGGGHGAFQHGGEGHGHSTSGGNASSGGADFALLVSKVPASMTTPRCPVGVLPIRATSDSDCLDLADMVTVKLSHPGCSTRVRCSHTGRALSTMLRAIVCARRRLRGGVAGGGDIVVEPQVVFEADEHSVDTAALYLNVWRLGH